MTFVSMNKEKYRLSYKWSSKKVNVQSLSLNIDYLQLNNISKNYCHTLLIQLAQYL